MRRQQVARVHVLGPEGLAVRQVVEDEVLRQRPVGAVAAHRGLPHVPVRVDHAGHHDAAGRRRPRPCPPAPRGPARSRRSARRPRARRCRAARAGTSSMVSTVPPRRTTGRPGSTCRGWVTHGLRRRADSRPHAGRSWSGTRSCGRLGLSSGPDRRPRWTATCDGRGGSVARTDTGPDFIEALARGLDVLKGFRPGRPTMTLSEVADGDRAGPPDGPTHPDHPRAPGLRRAAAPTASRSRRGCSSSAWPTSSRWGCGTSPARTSRRWSAAPASPARSRSSTGRTSCTWPGWPSRRSSRSPCTLGTRFPALQTSLGKVLLAALDDDELDAVLRQPSRVRRHPALAARPRRAHRGAARGAGVGLGADRRAARPRHPLGRGAAARRRRAGGRRHERHRARRRDLGRDADRPTTCRACCSTAGAVSADFARLSALPRTVVAAS